MLISIVLLYQPSSSSLSYGPIAVSNHFILKIPLNSASKKKENDEKRKYERFFLKEVPESPIGIENKKLENQEVLFSTKLHD
jgi:hypothetical protein